MLHKNGQTILGPGEEASRMMGIRTLQVSHLSACCYFPIHLSLACIKKHNITNDAYNMHVNRIRRIEWNIRKRNNSRETRRDRSMDFYPWSQYNANYNWPSKLFPQKTGALVYRWICFKKQCRLLRLCRQMTRIKIKQWTFSSEILYRGAVKEQRENRYTAPQAYCWTRFQAHVTRYLSGIGKGVLQNQHNVVTKRKTSGFKRGASLIQAGCAIAVLTRSIAHMHKG
jgi:hypothetical protein